MLLFPVRFFQRFQADLPDKIHKTTFVFLWLARADLYRLQAVRHNILEIRLPDLPNSFNSKRILLITVRQDIPHEEFENIFLDENGCSFGNLQRFYVIGKVLEGIQVGIQLIIQTAFKPAALTAEFALVNGEVLITGCCGINGLEVGEPGAAA